MNIHEDKKRERGKKKTKTFGEMKQAAPKCVIPAAVWDLHAPVQ